MFKPVAGRFTKHLVLGTILAAGCGGEPLTLDDPVERAELALHSWGNYHWARTSNPFTLKFGDNVGTAWDSYLAEASSDWNPSTVLDTTIVTGGGGTNCRATSGRIEVCNRKYGSNGWLGLAQIWTSGSHITQATAKMNDTYFATAAYNKPGWRRLVMCQEVAHGFGLGHQDEGQSNPNLGSCMDYTSDPDGTIANPDQLSNEHPNAHDFDQLVTIYSDDFDSGTPGHVDGTTTVNQSGGRGRGAGEQVDTGDGAEDVGDSVSVDGHGRPDVFIRQLGNGNAVLTHVLWAL